PCAVASAGGGRMAHVQPVACVAREREARAVHGNTGGGDVGGAVDAHRPNRADHGRSRGARDDPRPGSDQGHLAAGVHDAGSRSVGRAQRAPDARVLSAVRGGGEGQGGGDQQHVDGGAIGNDGGGDGGGAVDAHRLDGDEDRRARGARADPGAGVDHGHVDGGGHGARHRSVGRAKQAPDARGAPDARRGDDQRRDDGVAGGDTGGGDGGGAVDAHRPNRADHGRARGAHDDPRPGSNQGHLAAGAHDAGSRSVGRAPRVPHA
ncbi:hypothetical protein BU14_0609s0004, partial [Porphyra umbilicalis]